MRLPHAAAIVAEARIAAIVRAVDAAIRRPAGRERVRRADDLVMRGVEGVAYRIDQKRVEKVQA